MKIKKGKILMISLICFVILASIYLVSNTAAEQVGSSPESGETSRVMEMYNYLVGGGVGSDNAGSWGDWGSVMNRIRSAVEASVSGPTNCPTGMIPVPPSSTGRPGFCVDKYEAKQSGSVAVSEASGTPWVNIAQYDARGACRAAGKRLITEEQWLQIAQDVEQVGWNWSGGTPGSGNMSDGHSDSSPGNSLAASTDDDPCYGTGQTCDINTWNSQRRTYRLSNGEYIWDLGGNVWQWVDGFTYAHYPYLNNWSNWASCTNPDGICGNTLATNDKRYGGNTTALRAFPRGGNWDNGTSAGAFAINLYITPSYTSTSIGFRCAR